MLTSKQRAHLRTLANKTETIFQVGKLGITPELTQAIDDALEARELVKIALLNNCDMEVGEAADIIHERTRSDVVQTIGRKIVFFRQSKKKPIIVLP